MEGLLPARRAIQLQWVWGAAAAASPAAAGPRAGTGRAATGPDPCSRRGKEKKGRSGYPEHKALICFLASSGDAVGGYWHRHLHLFIGISVALN